MTRRKREDLLRMSQVMQIAFEADQARMRRLMTREEELRDRLDDLRARPIEQSPDGSIDPAVLAGADLRWQRWAEERRREINLSLARLRVEQAQVASQLSRSFGRSRVMSGLISADRVAKDRSN